LDSPLRVPLLSKRAGKLKPRTGLRAAPSSAWNFRCAGREAPDEHL
jgi:hypothetical protein